MLIGTAVTARILGPDGRGLLVATISWITLIGTIASSSLGEVSQYLIQSGGRRDWLPGLLGSMLLCAVGLSALAIAMSVVVYWSTAGEFMRNIPFSLFSAALIVVPTLIWEQYARYLMLGIGKIRALNVAQAFAGTAGVTAVLLFVVVLDFGVQGAVFAHVLGGVVLGSITVVLLWRTASFRARAEITTIRQLFSGALKLHMNTIGGLLMAHTNILMLNHFTTGSNVGWYQLGMQLVMAMLIVPQAASMILYSRIADRGPDRAWPEQKRLIIQMFGLLLALSAVAYALAPEIVKLVAGREFARSTDVFRQLLPVLFAMSFAQLMAPQWIGRGIFLPTSILTLGAGLANIALNLVLIPSYGLTGAIWAMNVTYFGVVMVVQSVFAGWVERKSRMVCSS